MFLFGLSIAAETTTRRVDVFIDEDLYRDTEVLEGLLDYIDVIEKLYPFKLRIKSFPPALVLDKSTLKFKEGSSAESLREEIRKSWQDESSGELAGAMLIGNLPFAKMEFFVREDTYPAMPGDGKIIRYLTWTPDLYFMDLDGIWVDELFADGCVEGGSCPEVVYGSNGILDLHYRKDGVLATDTFDIWVTRINPYGEARSLNSQEWNNQLQNYDSAYMPEVKKLLLRWLDKARKQHLKNEPDSDKSLLVHAEPLVLRKEYYPDVNFIRDLADMYNETDVIIQNGAKDYLLPIQKDYDWVVYHGHSSDKGLMNGASVEDFEVPFEVTPRLFDLVSCSSMRYVTQDWKSFDRSIGQAHLFRTLNGGVSVIGAMKTTGGYQDEEYLYSLLQKGEFLGDAVHKWANHRALVFDISKYPQEIYDWFYSHGLFGDPFIRLKVNRKNVKKDEFPKNIALHSIYDMVISGMSKCYDSPEGVGMCNIVSESQAEDFTVRLFNSVEVGNIYSKGKVSVENNSKIKNLVVYNSFNDADISIDKTVSYDMITYMNPARWDDSVEKRETLEVFSTDSCHDVTVEQDSMYVLTAGECINSLNLDEFANLTIPAGKFYIGSLYIGVGSKVYFSKPGYSSVMHVKGVFGWNGHATPVDSTVSFETIAKGFKVYLYDKDKYSKIGGRFCGTVYAPGNSIGLRGINAYGSFLGDGIEVSESKVYYVPFEPIDDGLTPIKFAQEKPSVVSNGARIASFNRHEISLEVGEAGAYSISVMNMLGQEVASFKIDASVGRNTVNWNPSNLAKGRYIVSLKHGTRAESKLFLLK